MKNLVKQAVELSLIIEQRKTAEKREKELKELFKTKMSEKNLDTLTIGGVLISLVEKSRTGLDRSALVAKFGEIAVSKCETQTDFIQVDVKTVQGFKKVA